MRLSKVMDEVADTLTKITGLRVTPHPVKTLVAPGGAIGYPERVAYDLTYGRGVDKIESLPVALYAGQATSRSARDTAAGWADGAGPTSVKTAIEAGPYTSCDDVFVTSAEFAVESVAGVDYIQVLFLLDIIGGGN